MMRVICELGAADVRFVAGTGKFRQESGEIEIKEITQEKRRCGFLFIRRKGQSSRHP
jgi:hypothetical protein